MNPYPCTHCIERERPCWAKDDSRGQGCLFCAEKKQKCSLVGGAAGLPGLSSDDVERLVVAQEKLVGAQERIASAAEEQNALLRAYLHRVDRQE